MNTLSTPSPGLFITFEGLDGSGKTLQSQALGRMLTQAGHSVVSLRDPGGPEISEAIRGILLDLRHQNMDATTELLLYEAARAQLVAESIRPALAKGQIVICDRFYDSTTAYQGHGRKLSLELIEKANEIGSQGLVPDRSYILDIPWEESLKRRSGGQADRMESEAHHFYDAIRSGYQELSRQHPRRIRWLDGCQQPEKLEQIIGNDVFNLIDHMHSPSRFEGKIS